jgi:hypothetical protein
MLLKILIFVFSCAFYEVCTSIIEFRIFMEGPVISD